MSEIVKDTNPKDLIGARKAKFSTVPAAVIMEIGLAMLEGACKYGRHNYRGVGVRASVYYDAAMGHIADWWEGQDIDADSNLSHVVKALASLVVLRDAMLQGKLDDDRPPRSRVFKADFNDTAAEIIERYAHIEPRHWTISDKGSVRKSGAVFGAKPDADLPQKERGAWVYIAGPMRSIPHFNFPAFDAARDKLAQMGYNVVSPADLDRDEGFDAMLMRDDSDWNVIPDGLNERDIVERDVDAVMDCDELVRLTGWESSTGAKAEVALAVWMGKKVWDLPT